jgi:hypothetical protein
LRSIGFLLFLSKVRNPALGLNSSKMRSENSQLDRDYERAKAQNDWQGMAAAHALRMANRTSNIQPDPEPDIYELFVAIAIAAPISAVLLWAIYVWTH